MRISLKLGIDLDGCLVDFNAGYVDLLIKEKGEDLFPPDRNADNFPPVWFYERHFGYGDVEEAVWKKIKESPDFWQKLGPLPTAVATLQQLDILEIFGHEVYFITHRSGREVKKQSEIWLVGHGFEFPTVLIAGDKAPIIQALELDFYIDDKPETIIELHSMKYPKHLYLKDAPYNRHVSVGNRVSTVLEALEDVLNGK